MDKTRYCIANWKMNITASAAMKFMDAWQNKNLSNKSVKTIICPPFTALYPISSFIEKISFELGAQNVYHEDVGSFTGEISCKMLKELGCQWVIIGHSERRTIFGETNEMIRRKLHHVVSKGMSAILCVGENLKQKKKGTTKRVLKHQLTKVLSTKKDFKKIIIAYEPVWAIGTGKTPTVKDISNTILYMKDILAKKSSIYKQVQILYGGSVNVNNSKLFLNNMNIDGLLVGKASLNFNSFFSMIKHK